MKKYKWMNENIEMIYYFINKLMIFINDNGQDFKLNTDNESFNENFANFLYDKYYSNKDFGNIEYDNNFDYFDTKFCSDMSDLFSDMKNIAYGFTNDIFKNSIREQTFKISSSNNRKIITTSNGINFFLDSIHPGNTIFETFIKKIHLWKKLVKKQNLLQ